MKTKKILVIHNPAAGRDDSDAQLVGALKTSGLLYDIIEVSTPPEAVEALKSMSTAEYGTIAVSAGDGTVIAAIKSVYDKNIPVLILPGGSANLLAKSLQLPPTIEECIDLLAHGTYETVSLPLADIDNQKLLLDVHFGFWARAIRRTTQASKQRFGQLAYGVTAAKHIFDSKKQLFAFSVDGQHFKIRAHALYIANQGDQQFAGAPLFLHRSPGLLYIAAIRSVNPLSIAWWMFMRGMNRESPKIIQTLYGKEIVLNQVPKTGLFDDDSYEPSLPVRISLGTTTVSLIQSSAEA